MEASEMWSCVSWGRIWNATIRQELNILLVTLEVEIYKERWKEHVSNMQKEKIPVSYTHLDVYKRQVWMYIVFLFWPLPVCWRLWPRPCIPITVFEICFTTFSKFLNQIKQVYLLDGTALSKFSCHCSIPSFTSDCYKFDNLFFCSQHVTFT